MYRHPLKPAQIRAPANLSQLRTSVAIVEVKAALDLHVVFGALLPWFMAGLGIPCRGSTCPKMEQLAETLIIIAALYIETQSAHCIGTWTLRAKALA